MKTKVVIFIISLWYRGIIPVAIRSLSVRKKDMYAAKNLVTAQAIAAYRKAIVGTNIYKFAEDYALVILINTSIPMAWTCIYSPQILISYCM